MLTSDRKLYLSIITCVSRCRNKCICSEVPVNEEDNSERPSPVVSLTEWEFALSQVEFHPQCPKSAVELIRKCTSLSPSSRPPVTAIKACVNSSWKAVSDVTSISFPIQPISIMAMCHAMPCNLLYPLFSPCRAMACLGRACAFCDCLCQRIPMTPCDVVSASMSCHRVTSGWPPVSPPVTYGQSGE